MTNELVKYERITVTHPYSKTECVAWDNGSGLLIVRILGSYFIAHHSLNTFLAVEINLLKTAKRFVEAFCVVMDDIDWTQDLEVILSSHKDRIQEYNALRLDSLLSEVERGV